MSWKDRLGKVWGWVCGARLWIIAGTAVLVLLVIVALPETNWETAVPKFGRLKTVAEILTPLILMTGIVAAVRRIQVAEQSQITDRFSKAVEQLADDKLAIRLGGIYALERIARDSERDHWPIMEILSAFLRENSPARKTDGQEMSLAAMDGKAVSDALGIVSLSMDGQAVCTVLKRRRALAEPEALDLTGANLAGANLQGANLAGAVLSGAVLAFANLLDTNLQGASLDSAVLVRTNFWRASLPSAHLWGADLREAILQDADLRNAVLVRANLCRADFQGANLAGAILDGANLRGANIELANLRNASLFDTDLRDVNLDGAKGLTQEQIEAALVV